MIDPERVGAVSSPVTHEVEAGAIRKFALAIGDSSPIHHDVDYAVSAGFSGLVAPPTFPVTFLDGSSDLVGIDFNHPAVLLGEQAFEYERPIVAGDRVTVVRRLDELGEKDAGSGAMDLLSMLEEGTDAEGKFLYRSRRLIIIRRG